MGGSHERRKWQRALAKAIMHQPAHKTEIESNPAPNGKHAGLRLEHSLAFAAVVIAIVLSLSPPTKPWETGTWLFILFGCGIYPVLHLASWIAPNSPRLSSSIALVLLAGSVAIFGFEKWPTPPLLIKITWKDSPLFTPKRKEALTRTLNDYYRYLTDQVGLNLPNEVPPLGVGPKGGPLLSGGELGVPPFYSHLIMTEDTIDNVNVLREVYSMYLFDLTLNPGVLEGQLRLDYEEAAWVFMCYYSSSFVNKPLCDVDIPGSKWNSTLWDVRREYGQPYTDSLVAFTLKMWPHSPPQKVDNFDAFFIAKLVAAETVVNNDQERYQKIGQLASRHGVQPN